MDNTQARLNLQIGAAIQHIVDVERTLDFDKKHRLSQADKYKIHTATHEATSAVHQALDKRQWWEVSEMIKEKYQSLKESASEYHPQEWTYATAVRLVLENVHSRPYLYNRE